MKTIYTGWPGLRLAPELAVEDDPAHPQFGWLFAKHPDGQWVTLADLKPLRLTNDPKTTNDLGNPYPITTDEHLSWNDGYATAEDNEWSEDDEK